MFAIYARVSTEEQARSGYSLDDQVRRGIAKYNSLGIYEDIIEYIDDGYSGEFIERPALDRLRTDIRAGIIKTVVVYDLDRLSRETEHLLILVKEIERKAKLIFCTNEYAKTPSGELFMTLHAGIAKYEKAMIKERTMRGKREKALSGKLTHNDNPLGYDYDEEKSMYVINESEAETIRFIFDLYVKNSYGVRQLALELKALGKTNKKGQPINKTQVYRILKNEMYAGTKWSFRRYDKKVGQKKVKQLIRSHSEWIPITVPAIISQDLWQQAQDSMHQKSVVSKRNTKYEYLLKNVVKCGVCGYNMVGQTYYEKRWGKDKKYSYYVCTSIPEKRGCSSKRIPSAELDKMVWDQLVKRAKNNRLSTLGRRSNSDKDVKQKLSKHIVELKKRQSTIIKLITNGTIEADIAENELKELNRELAATKTALSSSKEEQPIQITRTEILAATSFEHKRNILLKLKNRQIYAVRNGKELDWWIE